MWVIIYKSYGEWRCTCPFATTLEAEKHAQRYLKVPEKDYITDVQPIYIKEMAAS